MLLISFLKNDILGNQKTRDRNHGEIEFLNVNSIGYLILHSIIHGEFECR